MNRCAADEDVNVCTLTNRRICIIFDPNILFIKSSVRSRARPLRIIPVEDADLVRRRLQTDARRCHLRPQTYTVVLV
jgi:hypothetical protein